ncbi:MAG TPA: hypothetical protein VFY71_00760 [Planctomycetota bacterium]|nr:hypothetical protein [Planctomycetota bacterium]
MLSLPSRALAACALSLLVPLAGCASPSADAQAQPAASGARGPGEGLGMILVRVSAGPETPDPARVSVSWASLDRSEGDSAPASGTTTVAPHGRWRTDQLPYGQYELTVRYADGPPVIRRVTVDEPRERLDVVMPHGHIVIRTDRPLRELSVRCATNWQGTAVRTWTNTTDAEIVAEGLGRGQYIVRATYDNGSMVIENVRLTDLVSDVAVDVRPVPPGELRLTLTGWSDLDDTESFLVEAYAQTPTDRLFDFGDPILARTIPRGTQSVTMRLPPGRFGVLISSRSPANGRTGLLGFLPDIVSMPGGSLEETADLAVPRRVLLRGTEGELNQLDFSFRLGADLLPVRLVTSSPDVLRTQGVLLPTRDCAVVAGFIRRLSGLESGTVADVVPGPGAQEIELAVR